MIDALLGQIVLFAGNFAPEGWMLCDGSTLPISNFTALYAVIGTTYGGDGRNSFKLPDLRGRFPTQQGSGNGLSPHNLGDAGGAETVTLTVNNLPAHTHGLAGATGPVTGTQKAIDTRATATKVIDPDEVQPTGANVPFQTLSPFLALNFIICVNGTFPTRP